MMDFNPQEHLIDLKGKKYLKVMWRLVWFREEKPLWNIETKLERLENDHAVFTAKIYDENGVQKSAGHGSESIKDFKDYIEKAETKAVGRALAMLGYGTQFAPELDEEERIVDSPVKKPIKAKSEKSVIFACENCNEAFQLQQYMGKTYTAEYLYNNSKLLSAKIPEAEGKVLCKKCRTALTDVSN